MLRREILPIGDACAGAFSLRCHTTYKNPSYQATAAAHYGLMAPVRSNKVLPPGNLVTTG